MDIIITDEIIDMFAESYIKLKDENITYINDNEITFEKYLNMGLSILKIGFTSIEKWMEEIKHD